MRIMMKFRKSVLALIAVFCVMAFSADSCDTSGDSDGQKEENKARQSNYDTLVKNQPAAHMAYSPTRDTKNFWINTWSEKGKVSYVYLLSGGKPYAFAVFKRLPVSYCTSLVRPQEAKEYDFGENGSVVALPAPSIDGTYGSSNNCSTFYGEDATTGAYVEFTAGQDSTMLLRDQPLPINLFADALPLGDTTAEQAVDADDDKATLTGQ